MPTTFVIYDDALGVAVIVGDVDGALDYIKTYLTEMDDGDELEFDVRREDMTAEQIEAAPVV